MQESKHSSSILSPIRANWRVIAENAVNSAYMRTLRQKNTNLIVGARISVGNSKAVEILLLDYMVRLPTPVWTSLRALETLEIGIRTKDLIGRGQENSIRTSVWGRRQARKMKNVIDRD
jgi:hypothetical protein